MQLLCAAESNHTTTALLLLRLGGAKIDLKDRHGRTSLSYSIARGNVPLTLALISDVCGLAVRLRRIGPRAPERTQPAARLPDLPLSG